MTNVPMDQLKMIEPEPLDSRDVKNARMFLELNKLRRNKADEKRAAEVKKAKLYRESL